MFSLLSGLYSEYFSPQQINLLVVGVQGSGKTTLLERIKVTDFPAKSVITTVSSSSDLLEHSDGGSNKQQPPPHPHAKHNKVGPAPEQLRSKIFLSDALEDYEPPASSRHRLRPEQPSSPLPQLLPPKSRFAWLCPPPPKFRQSRMDTSDRNDPYSDDLHNSDHFFDDPKAMNDSEDDSEAESLTNKERSSPTARSRIAIRRSNSNPSLLTLGSSSHHRNALLAASAPPTHHGGGPAGLPAPRRITDYTSSDELRKSSMESIDLTGGGGATSSTLRSPRRQQQFAYAANEQRSFLDDAYEDDTLMEQHDLKAGAKMLQLEKIRPTIGMNLAKAEICGAKVHIWDLGGKLQDLWNRYYNDADAVIFVWKLSRDDVLRQQDGDFADDEMDDSSRRAPVTADAQKIVLEKVRSAVPDDVPFVILGNLFQPRPPCNCEPDVLYSTSQLLPHYHNPHQAVFMANAVSGQGVKMALEWLLTTAKRQKRLRERSADGAYEK